MSISKRGRGRPKGSETDDSKVLAAVADMITADPKLAPTTAMRKADPQWTQASLRRYQDKWKRRGSGLLAAAQARIQAKVRRPISAGAFYAAATGDISYYAAGSSARAAAELASGSAARAAAELANGAVARAAVEAACGAHTRLAVEMARGGAGHRAIDLASGNASYVAELAKAGVYQQAVNQIDSPHLKAALRAVDDPYVRALRDLEVSGMGRAFHALEEQEKLLRYTRGY